MIMLRLLIVEILGDEYKRVFAKAQAFDLIAEVFRALKDYKTPEAIYTRDVIMGAMIGGGVSDYLLGRKRVQNLLGIGKVRRSVYEIRRRLRYLVMSRGKHGFKRDIYKSSWSRHTQHVRDLCRQWFYSNDEVWERDQEGTKVKKKGKPDEVIISTIQKFCFGIRRNTFLS